MNQILSVENPNNNKKKRKSKGNNGTIEISKIAMFFAIALIIFGIAMIGSASYGMYKAKQDEENKPTKPEIIVENLSKDTLNLKVTTTKETINNVVYYWNDENEKTISGNTRKYIEEEIKIPAGENVLHVVATTISGQENVYEETFTRESDISIQFEVSGNNIIVNLEGKEEISYITYRWDENEEKKIDINSTTSKQEIETEKGLHTLTVVAVDKNNNTETKEQEINGVMKPELTVTTDGKDNFIIKATDEQGLKKVEFIINETEKYMLNLDGRTELDYSYPLHDGENKIEVTVYNQNDVSSNFKAKLTK